MASKGKGSLVTMMSKTTANKATEVLIQQTIAGKRERQGCSHLTSNDRCAVIVQYGTDAVHERLIVDMEIKQCAGNATEGAANMQGQHGGLPAQLTGESLNQVHTWCPQPCAN